MADLTGMMQAAAGAGEDAVFVEDVFSTYLYTGTGATRTITNNIDLSGKGGLVWLKERSGGEAHGLFDTLRGATYELQSANNGGQSANVTTLTAFTSSGFTVGTNGSVNGNALTYASWTFREQAKFFDVVTYTGNGANRTIAHNLDSVPGSIWIKRTDDAGNWQCYHRSLANTEYLVLNTTAAKATGATRWNSTTPTSTVFSLGTDSTVNANGGTYVAYIFAHDAGGFGTAGTDNVISCGSFSTDGSGAATVTLGYEPQWLITKSTSAAVSWYMLDNMRGFIAAPSTQSQYFKANTSDAEASWGSGVFEPTATGFKTTAGLGENRDYIYIAIRRGPMKTPTSGTSVFGLSARSGTGANATVTGSAGVSDAVLVKNRGAAVASLFSSRLTGTGYLVTSTTAAEVAAATTILQANPWDVMDGVKVGTTSTITNATSNTYINYLFSRAPGFFDVAIANNNGSTGVFTSGHNLGVTPTLCIARPRTAVQNWQVAVNTGSGYRLLNLNQDYSDQGAATFTANSTTFTWSSYAMGFGNDSSVAYLFATVAGVSKVGTYTGNGSSVTVTTGFQPRFILVKRTDSTGNWIVGDSARGFVAGDDPFFLANTDAAETTNQDWVDVSGTGFTVNETGANANVSTATYIFLAIS